MSTRTCLVPGIKEHKKQVRNTPKRAVQKINKKTTATVDSDIGYNVTASQTKGEKIKKKKKGSSLLFTFQLHRGRFCPPRWHSG